MEPFVMEIAGAVFLVQPLFQSTREYCRPYLTDKEPEYFITVMPENLIQEQQFLDREALEEGLKFRKFKEPFLERSVIQRHVANFLLSRNTLMLHGSTVSVDGLAYLFTAPCGTGKSTHTRLWRELFGQRAIMVNDDKPFLRLTSDAVLAYGSPWSGKHGLASNVCVPLKGICSLSRGKDNLIQAARKEDLMDLLLRQVYIPEDPAMAQSAVILLNRLTECVPLWEMQCNKDPEAAKVAYSAMCFNSD